MNAEINELFEEGITRSRELSDAADETMGAIDEMAKEAEELAQRVEDEGKEACQHMRDLASRLEQAEGALESSRTQADGALEGLSGKAAELKTEALELLEKVRVREDEGLRDYYFFKFHEPGSTTWHVGRSGPFDPNVEPNLDTGATFSEFDEFGAKTMEEHIGTYLDVEAVVLREPAGKGK